MSRLVLVLRPQPGADASAARARELGLDPVVVPMFRIARRTWTQPPGRFDAIMLTSANAARFSSRLAKLELPIYAVGDSSAEAARRAGFPNPRVGPSDGTELVRLMARDGIGRALHPCGEHHLAVEDAGVEIIDLPVYASEAVDSLPDEAAEALRRDALVLLHSPRAAELFAALVAGERSAIRLAAISDAAAASAGPGWGAVHVAERPRDAALLALAAKLCQT